MCRLGLGVGISLIALTLSAPSWAQSDDATRSAARKVALDGIAALQRGDADTATSKLEKAYAVLKAPSVALWSARALVKRGQLVEASERYLAATRLTYSGGDQAVQEQAKQDAAQELAALTPRIPSVQIMIEGATASEVSITLDGKPVPAALLDEERPANPGTHELVANRGKERLERSVQLAEGEKQRAVFQFQPLAASSDGSALNGASTNDHSVSQSSTDLAPGRARKTLAFATLAAGGAGLAVGTVAAILAQGKRNDLNNGPYCSDDKCLPAAGSEVSSFRTLRTVSSVGFIAGGALAATGVVLLLTSRSSAASDEHAFVAPEAPRLALRVGPCAIDLGGSF
jgi:hypothetical protein